MDFTNWNPTKADHRHKATMALARDEPKRIDIKLSNQDQKQTNEEMEQSTFDEQTGVSSIYGYDVIQPGELSAIDPPELFRCNIQLYGDLPQKKGKTDIPILVRIGPTRFNNKSRMEKLAATGRVLVQALIDTAHPHAANSRNDAAEHPIFHLGFWTKLGHPH